MSAFAADRICNAVAVSPAQQCSDSTSAAHAQAVAAATTAEASGLKSSARSTDHEIHRKTWTWVSLHEKRNFRVTRRGSWSREGTGKCRRWVRTRERDHYAEEFASALLRLRCLSGTPCCQVPPAPRSLHVHQVVHGVEEKCTHERRWIEHDAELGANRDVRAVRWKAEMGILNLQLDCQTSSL